MPCQVHSTDLRAKHYVDTRFDGGHHRGADEWLTPKRSVRTHGLRSAGSGWDLGAPVWARRRTPGAIDSQDVMQKSPKPRPRWIRILGACCAALIVLLVAVWLTFQHKPSWYRPARIAESELQSVRDSLTDANLEFSSGLASGQPFDFSLDAKRVNQWIAAREHIYPEAEPWVPSWVRDPVVAFEGGKLILAGVVEFEGWKAVASAHVAVELADESIRIRLAGVRGGSLPIPLSSGDEAIGALASQSARSGDALPEALRLLTDEMRTRAPSEVLREGTSVANRFEYPDGKRRFRILKCQFNDGTMTLRIEPL